MGSAPVIIHRQLTDIDADDLVYLRAQEYIQDYSNSWLTDIADSSQSLKEDTSKAKDLVTRSNQTQPQNTGWWEKALD